MLFADLVGFTTLSEGRDHEDVRELLGRYYESAKRLVALYGGTIEKFIGDAVMAVWGSPVAQEDDAERAVRAALDLVASVTELGAAEGMPDLRARAGVLTGEAAVSLGAEGQGMVVGDLVNTASRIQSAAQPGTVLVGEGTRRATEAAIVYEDAGSHEMKGKAEPVSCWRALRVVAGRGGAMKSTSLEAPFVGREREIRLIKELFHTSAESRRAHLASVIGIGGIGKSRLAWEFEKYVDGLLDSFLWHRGRCLAYGEGVTYWALAEMVRMRARISEGEDAATATGKLLAVIAQYVGDAEEREWIEPRLAHLLGLEERNARDAEDLFSAWRLFFERMTETSPVVLVFEDMQWADQSLVDFVDYLMNWSKNHPLFVVMLSRPEFADKHPDWGSGRRGSTTLYLEPLSEQAMNDLLSGLVPGLPEALRAKILARAEGVPLYAVETVRMLLDRGLLVQGDASYSPTGPVEDLEIPETLQALIAARLDGLGVAERRLLQDAAVVGKTFSKGALVALSGLEPDAVEDLLGSLLRKEFLSIQADPRSPEHGQYGFLQDLVRRVAYETLARKDRKARHLTAARFLETEWGRVEDEVVEVIASHYSEAYQSMPDAPDAPEIKAKARDALVQAGRHAESLAASEEARRYFERAIELTDDDLLRSDLHERAGRTARDYGRTEEAMRHYEAALALHETAGRTHAAARVSASYADVLRDLGRMDDAIDRMRAAYQVLSGEEADADFATLAHQLARLLFFTNEHEEAMALNEQALLIAERLQVDEVFVHALTTKSLLLWARSRSEEAMILLKHALEIALDHDFVDAAIRTMSNIGAQLNEQDLHKEEFATGQQQIELSRKFGNRTGEWRGLAGQIGPLYYLGRWDQALQNVADMEEAEYAGDILQTVLVEFAHIPLIHAFRGNASEARKALDGLSSLRDSIDLQEMGSYASAEAWLLFLEGRYEEGLMLGEAGFSKSSQWAGPRSPQAKELFTALMECAFALGDLKTVEVHLAEIESLAPGEIVPYVVSQAARFRARLAIANDRHDSVAADFAAASKGFRDAEMPMWVAIVALEQGEWLLTRSQDTAAAQLFAEAREVFEQLRMRPMLERLERVAGSVVTQATTG